MNRRALLETTSFCKQISAFACDFNHTALSSCHFAAVANTLLDTHAVAVAGWFEPAALRLRSYLKVSGALTGKRHSQAGLCRLWGEDEWVFPEAAALANGVAAHVLDFDVVSSAMRGHPSVALWPGLLALAEARDVPGVRLASAFVVGFEVLLKLSRAMAQEHYALGWHSTSTLGTIAGAVACSHLLSHNAQQVEASIGIAIAQCAGSRQNFGSDTKSFQAGHCNAAAVRAALLASEGFTAGEGALDGPGGFVDLYGGEKDLKEGVIRAVGDPHERFSEDALRIVRAIRLSAELGFSIEEGTKKAMGENVGLLQKISRERIRDEFARIISSSKPMKKSTRICSRFWNTFRSCKARTSMST